MQPPTAVSSSRPAKGGGRAGTYSFADAGLTQPVSISLDAAGTGLVASATDWFWYNPIELYPTSSNVFLFRAMSGQMTFEFDATGVTGVDLVEPGASFIGIRQ